MKRTNQYLSVTLALLLGLAACTPDESLTNTTPADGLYPLQIGTVSVTAEVSNGLQTRMAEATDGESSLFEFDDVITVSLNGDTATYTYDGDIWTPDTLLYWTSTADTLIAWYTSPSYTTNDTIVSLSDQSEGLAYVLRAEAGFARTVDINFSHQLAKVRVTNSGSYDTSDAVLLLTAPTTCTVSQGAITATGDEGTIIMYQTTYNSSTCWEATVPDSMKIASVTIAGKAFELSEAVTTTAGSLHTISLTVNTQ